MPRPLWTGSLSFGLVNVPVQLFSGVKDTDVHFRQLHDKDHTPVETRRFCVEEDAEVEWDEIAHGFETKDGKQVILTDEELAAAAPRKTRTIEIESFVDLEEVDPIHFDHPYTLMPAGDSEGTQRAYRLLLEVMRATDRAALGRFVMRTKEYLVLIRERAGRLTLTTLLWHDEVRPAKGIPTPSKQPAKNEVDRAVKLIEALATDWDPSRYKDNHQQRLKRVIKRKEKGETIKTPQTEQAPSPVEDLMAALEKSLAEAGGRSKAAA
jgi:DNA end-binding protein Ku